MNPSPKAGSGAAPPEMTRTQGVVTQLTKNDVVLGRGSQPWGNIGKTKFREIIQGRQQEYLSSTKRKDKDLIARQVMSAVARHQGRFLQKIESSVESEQLGVPKGVEAWRVVDESAVLKKIKDLFRVRESSASSTSRHEKGADPTGKGTKAGGMERPDSTTSRPQKKTRGRQDAPRNPAAPDALQPDNIARQPSRMMPGAAPTASLQPPTGHETLTVTFISSRKPLPLRGDTRPGATSFLQSLSDPGSGHSSSPNIDMARAGSDEVTHAALQSLPASPGRGTSSFTSHELTNNPALAGLFAEIEEQRQAKRAAMMSLFATGANEPSSSSSQSTRRWEGRPLLGREQEHDSKPAAVQTHPAARIAPGVSRPSIESSVAAALSERDHHLGRAHEALLSHSDQNSRAASSYPHMRSQSLNHSDLTLALAARAQRYPTVRAHNIPPLVPPARGRSEPVTTSQPMNDAALLERVLLRELAARNRTDSAALESPFAGRTRESATLSTGNSQFNTDHYHPRPSIGSPVEHRRQAARDLLNRLTQGGSPARHSTMPSPPPAGYSDRSFYAVASPSDSRTPERNEMFPVDTHLASSPAPAATAGTHTNERTSLLLSSMLSQFAATDPTQNEPQSQARLIEALSRRPGNLLQSYRHHLPSAQAVSAPPASTTRLPALHREAQPGHTLLGSLPTGRTTGEDCLWNSLDSSHSSEPTGLSLSLTELLSILVLCWYGVPTWGLDSLSGSGQSISSSKKTMKNWDDFALLMERASVEWCKGHPKLRYFKEEVDWVVGMCMAYRSHSKRLAQKTLSLFQKLLSIAVEKDGTQKLQRGGGEAVRSWMEDEMRRWKDTLRVPSSYTASDYVESSSSSSSTATIHLVSHLSTFSCRAIAQQVSCLSSLARIVSQLGDDASFLQHFHNLVLLGNDHDNDDAISNKNSLPSWWKADLIHYDASLVQALVLHGYPGVLKAPLLSPEAFSNLASIARGKTRQGQAQEYGQASGISLSLEERGGVTQALVQNRAEYLARLLMTQKSRRLLEDQLRKRSQAQLQAIYQDEERFS